MRFPETLSTNVPKNHRIPSPPNIDLKWDDGSTVAIIHDSRTKTTSAAANTTDNKGNILCFILFVNKFLTLLPK